MAILPGYGPGQVEAWAAEQMPFSVDKQGSGAGGDRQPAPSAMLHYSSDGADPLMSPGGRAQPLPDTAKPSDGEITLAAFGKSECQQKNSCPEPLGSNELDQVVQRHIVDELSRRASDPNGAALAVFTGDVSDSGGYGGEKGGGGFVP